VIPPVALREVVSAGCQSLLILTNESDIAAALKQSITVIKLKK